MAMEVDSVEYRLSCVLRGHEDDVSPVSRLKKKILYYVSIGYWKNLIYHEKDLAIMYPYLKLDSCGSQQFRLLCPIWMYHSTPVISVLNVDCCVLLCTKRLLFYW